MQHLTERFTEVFHTAPERFFSAPSRMGLDGGSCHVLSIRPTGGTELTN